MKACDQAFARFPELGAAVLLIGIVIAITLLFALLVVTYAPDLSLFVPRLLGYAV